MQVLDALHLSRATFQKIQQNLWWAFAYNLVGIPLAAGALLPTAGITLTPSIAGERASLDSLIPLAALGLLAGCLDHRLNEFYVSSSYRVSA